MQEQIRADGERGQPVDAVRPRPRSSSRPPGSKSLARQSAENAELLQRRLALFGRVLFILSLGFYLGLNAIRSATLHHGLSAWLFEEGNGYHLFATAVLLGVAAITSTKRVWPAQLLEVVDAIAVIAPSLAFAAMGYEIRDPGTSGVHAALLAVTNAVVARAVIVPSDASRTLAISAVCTFPVVATNYLVYRTAPDVDLFLSTVTAVLWCIVPTAIATVASSILWGLREEVREARTLGQYTLQEKIGEGGMGVVYRAKHALLRRPTAIKLLAGADVGEHQMKRFEREVQLTALLTHPNTISVFDFGRTPDGIFYYAMEYLDGIELEALVEEDGAQPPARVIHILRQVCGALSEAHGVGLIHRDIKPANIVLCARGGKHDVVKVLDFGLVKTLESSGLAAVSQSAVDVISGTPQYMAPESVLTPQSIDGRSDLYALGAVGYYLLTGTHVFEGKTVIEVCSQHLHSPPQRPTERLRQRAGDATIELPRDLEDVLLECLSKDPTARPSDAAKLEVLLSQCADADRWTETMARTWWDERATSGRPTSPEAKSPSQYPRLEVDMRDRSGTYRQKKV